MMRSCHTVEQKKCLIISGVAFFTADTLTYHQRLSQVLIISLTGSNQTMTVTKCAHSPTYTTSQEKPKGRRVTVVFKPDQLSADL